MMRFFLNMAFYVIIARWMYAEVNLMVPSVAPQIDRLMSAVQIPTHNNWHENGISGLISEAGSYIDHIRYRLDSSTASNTFGASLEGDEFGARLGQAAKAVYQTVQFSRDESFDGSAGVRKVKASMNLRADRNSLSRF